jgi:MFS family permease
MSDRSLFYTTAFLRAVSTSLLAVLIGIYLATRGIDAAATGSIVSFGLVGAALAAIVATFYGDALGRRRFLFLLTLLSISGTVLFAFSFSPLSLTLAAFFGMLNGMGKDRGAALIIEQAALPSTTTEDQRTKVIARYNMLQDLGHAFGALLAGLPSLIAASSPTVAEHSHQYLLLGCAALGVPVLFCYWRMSKHIESTEIHSGLKSFTRISTRSKSIILKISALFSIDSIAGGFLTTALLSYFFFERFGATEGMIGGLFFGARLLNALSHLGAAWLAKRIGLVNTMVFTHIPSSILLMTVAFAPNFTIAAILFLLREGLVEMDVPTRQSYVMAVVEPSERTIASGITNLVRLGSWAVAPGFSGLLMQTGSLYLPLVIGAGMKIVYDILLWRAFRGVKPPEER